MSQKYPYNENVSLSPHLAFGHPLPIRWGEGRVRGAPVSIWVGVIVKKRYGHHTRSRCSAWAGGASTEWGKHLVVKKIGPG